MHSSGHKNAMVSVTKMDNLNDTPILCDSRHTRSGFTKRARVRVQGILARSHESICGRDGTRWDNEQQARAVRARKASLLFGSSSERVLEADGLGCHAAYYEVLAHVQGAIWQTWAS